MNLLLKGLLSQSQIRGQDRVEVAMQRVQAVLTDLVDVIGIELAKVKNQGPDAEEAHAMLEGIHRIECVLQDWVQFRPTKRP